MMIEPEMVRPTLDTMVPYRQGKDLFTIEPNSSYSYLVIAITDTAGFGIFVEEFEDVACYRYDMLAGSSAQPAICTMEELLDEVGEHRPECFDWLLFHPEWL